jgi:hypothetical protein
MWLLCVWLIWKEHNNRIFNNVYTSITEKVKFNSYWWLRANNAYFVYGCQEWRSDPLFCLGIGWCLIMHLFDILFVLWTTFLIHLMLKRHLRYCEYILRRYLKKKRDIGRNYQNWLLPYASACTISLCLFLSHVRLHSLSCLSILFPSISLTPLK